VASENERPTVAMAPVKGTPDDLARKFAFDAALLDARHQNHAEWRLTALAVTVVLAVAGMAIAYITRF
jgi:hypothetical protein